MSTDSLCFYDEVSMLQLISMDRGTDKNIHELLPKTVILKKNSFRIFRHRTALSNADQK